MKTSSPTIGRHDRLSINIDDQHGMTYWSTLFGLTPEAMREAVRTAGHRYGALRDHVESPRKARPASRKGDPKKD